jgi:hypothetical protein
VLACKACGILSYPALATAWRVSYRRAEWDRQPSGVHLSAHINTPMVDVLVCAHT